MGAAVPPPLPLAAREAVALPDPAAVAASGADCKAEAEPSSEGLGEGPPVSVARAAVKEAAGLGDAPEGDPAAEDAGGAECSGEAVSDEDGEAPMVAIALGEKGAEAEGGALPQLESVPAEDCDGLLDGAEEGVAAAAEPEPAAPVAEGASDCVAPIVGGNRLAVGLGVEVATALELPPLRDCAVEPLLAALVEGAPLALEGALGEAQKEGAAVAVLHALQQGDGETLPLPACAADPAALLEAQPVLPPLTDARLPVLLAHEEKEGGREVEGEPEGQGEAAAEGLPLSQGRTLGSGDMSSAVLGYSVAASTFNDSMLNKQIKIDGVAVDVASDPFSRYPEQTAIIFENKDEVLKKLFLAKKIEFNVLYGRDEALSTFQIK